MKLKHLDAWIDRRRALAARYDAHVPSGLATPYVAPDNRHTYYVYVVRHKDRDRLMATLRDNDIVVNISYPWPISTMRGYESLGYKEGDLQTESAAKEIFSLPMYAHLRTEDAERVERAKPAHLRAQTSSNVAPEVGFVEVDRPPQTVAQLHTRRPSCDTRE